MSEMMGHDPLAWIKEEPSEAPATEEKKQEVAPSAEPPPVVEEIVAEPAVEVVEEPESQPQPEMVEQPAVVASESEDVDELSLTIWQVQPVSLRGMCLQFMKRQKIKNMVKC